MSAGELMSNNLLGSLQKIMEGDEPLPQRTSNTLLLAAIREVYGNQKDADNHRSSIAKHIGNMSEDMAKYGERMEDAEEEIGRLRDEEIGRLRDKSDRNDTVIGFLTILAGIIGSIFGQR